MQEVHTASSSCNSNFAFTALRLRLAPASEHLLSEPAIICRTARATLGEAGPRVPWEEFESDYDRVRDRIERVIPGFEDFNARVRRPGGAPSSRSRRNCHQTKNATEATKSTIDT